MEEEDLTFEDYKIFFALVCILTGLILSFYGVFFSGNTLAFALPLWIFSTVYITKNLTYDIMRDIVIEINK